jgi:hypothetical protein
MPDFKIIEAALNVSKDDESKVLGVKLGAKQVARGEKIPKAGKYICVHPLFLSCANCLCYRCPRYPHAQLQRAPGNLHRRRPRPRCAISLLLDLKSCPTLYGSIPSPIFSCMTTNKVRKPNSSSQGSSLALLPPKMLTAPRPSQGRLPLPCPMPVLDLLHPAPLTATSSCCTSSRRVLTSQRSCPRASKSA